MNTRTTSVEQRLRDFLLIVSGGLSLGTIVELLLAQHYESAVQILPFVLCAIGIIVVAAALWRPWRTTLWLLRGVMAVTILGSLFGIYEHVERNAAFASEIHSGVTGLNIWIETLTGAAPLLAPGMLALAAVLAIAGTYAHPALQRDQTTGSAAAHTTDPKPVSPSGSR